MNRPLLLSVASLVAVCGMVTGAATSASATEPASPSSDAGVGQLESAGSQLPDAQRKVAYAANIEIAPKPGKNLIAVEMSGLPAGLTHAQEGTTAKITGTPTTGGTYELQLITTWNTDGSTQKSTIYQFYTIHVASLSTYKQVIFDHKVKPSDTEKWSATCPAAFPWLSKHQSTDLIVTFGGDKVHGLEVSRESAWLHVGEDPFRSSDSDGDGIPDVHSDSDGDGIPDVHPGDILFFTGTDGWVTNVAAHAPYHLTMVMHCTDNINNAWGYDFSQGQL